MKIKETTAAPIVGEQRLILCSICERELPSEQLKEADDFDSRGSHRYLQICAECEVDFGKLDISFNFLVNN